MRSVKQWLTALVQTQSRYFEEYRDEIAIRNLHLIRMTCIAGSCIYVAYFAVTAIFFADKCISPLYGLIVPVLLAFLPYVSRSLRAERIDARGTSRVTYLLYIVMLSYIIIMSVFPNPTVPSAYYPLFVLMAPVIFVLPLYLHLATAAAGYVVFFSLVMCFKSPECRSHELFEATTAIVFAIVIILFMSQFRVQTSQSTEKYFKLSRTDGLTGLMNKTTGLALMESYAESPLNERYAVLFMDIDGFKSINDTYGHLMGDELLRKIGATLSEMFRRGDVICRFGGDEFLVLMKDISDKKVVKTKSSDVIAAIRALSDKQPYTLTGSVGICISTTREQTLDEVLLRADKALYEAKNRGKNQYRIYGSGNDGEAPHVHVG